jgi:hypothetical protein
VAAALRRSCHYETGRTLASAAPADIIGAAFSRGSSPWGRAPRHKARNALILTPAASER